MGRAEIRKAARQKTKKTATYNFTKEQLDILVKEKVKAEVAKDSEERTKEAINTAIILMLTLPLEVLMDHYWQDTYAEQIPEFTNYLLEYFHKWENGELNMDELQEDLWKYGGVKFEKTEE